MSACLECGIPDCTSGHRHDTVCPHLNDPFGSRRSLGPVVWREPPSSFPCDVPVEQHAVIASSGGGYGRLVVHTSTDGHLRAGEAVVVRITHSGGVHVHSCPSWRDAGRYVEGWATVARLLSVSMVIEPAPGPVPQPLPVGTPRG